MKVVAFIGKSGTGKSYRALWLAKQNNIEYIVDDGLLISNNKIIAGVSAKKEPTAVAATKRALFYDQKHKEDVKNAIKEHNPKSILLIATSDKMAEAIRTALEIDEISKTIYITDIATPKEINRAKNIRKNEGKHIIPVPTFELKKTFSGYFLDALKNFNKKGTQKFLEEKTIVRPSYSYLGRYFIYDKVIRQIAKHVATGILNEPRISIFVNNYEDNVEVTLNLVINYKQLNRDLFSKVQQAVKDEIENLTCMNVTGVNVVIKSLEVQ